MICDWSRGGDAWTAVNTLSSHRQWSAIEVDRAIDNLVKSGKLWTAPRRDSMPMAMGRPYPEYGMFPFKASSGAR